MIIPPHLQTGQTGETIAAEFLELGGYRVVGRNVHVGRLELDIIALDGDEIVFIEVKTLTRRGAFRPEDAVSPAKAARLFRAAKIWLSETPHYCLMAARFDVVAVLLLPGETPLVTHFKDCLQLDTTLVEEVET